MVQNKQRNQHIELHCLIHIFILYSARVLPIIDVSYLPDLGKVSLQIGYGCSLKLDVANVCKCLPVNVHYGPVESVSSSLSIMQAMLNVTKGSHL